MLTLIDEFSRQCLTIEMDRWLESGDGLGALAKVMAWRGVPEYDQGLLLERFRIGYRRWASAPSTSIQAACDKTGSLSFHNRLHHERLSQDIFLNVPEAGVVIEEWRRF